MKPNVTRPHHRLLSKIFQTGLLIIFFLFLWNIHVGGQVKKEGYSHEIEFKTVGNEPQTGLFNKYRRMVVGPWVHQPEEYEGYNGFVAWPGLTRLKSGRWLLTFSSGYWHASPPLTEDILKEEKSRNYYERNKKIGMPFVNAPRGGRAHIMHSDDKGKTWSDPTLLVDTEMDDRHPTIIELDDGTLLCTFFTYQTTSTAQARYILSHDQGQTWSESKLLPGNAAAFGNGSAIPLMDGSVVVAADQNSPKEGIAILRSTDRGETFKLASVVETDYPQYEPTIAQLKDGQLVLITRPKGDIYWSKDNGKTWTSPASTGVQLFDPHLVVLPNGVLACFHGSYKGGGLRVMLSPDNGHTWHGPKEQIGYAVDPSVYGYSHPMLLPDGTIYLVYIHTGGHHPADARTEALWTLRIRINENADGIEILPSPGGAQFTSQILSGSRSLPNYQRFEPEMVLSQEGFRSVKWATRIQDIPWEWSKSHFPANGYWRKVEDHHVFDVEAKWITYTFRNTVFYGVRIDIEGKNKMQKALEVVKKEYPPEKDIVEVNNFERSWNTGYTQVWVTMPETKDGTGTIFLWGKDKKFPDASIRPVYLIKPPALNSDPTPYVPRYYVIYQATDAITIDGDINEKAWQDAEWLDSFVDHQHPYAPQPWKTTRVKMIYDADYIYVAAQLQEENVWGTMSERDAIVYYENDFEIFLDPTANGTNYFEFELNPLNTMFDMWHELDNHRGAYADPVYDSHGTRHAIKVDGTLNYHHDIDNDWFVEVKIPLKELKQWNPEMSVPIKRGDMWRINFSRVQYLHVYTQLFPYQLPYSPCEDWVLGPTDNGDLHIPELWPFAVFSDRFSGELDDELNNKRPKVLPTPSETVPGEEEMAHFQACKITIGPDSNDPLHSPAHQVEVPEFQMDLYEVTVAEFTEFLNKGGRDQYYSAWMRIEERCGIVQHGSGKYSVVPGRENYPVVYVSHDAALAYAKSLGKTLPTEEMWERAARGLKGRKYPWGNKEIDLTMANYNFYYGGTAPVGSFPDGVTPEGIYDLSGNVKEWTNSRFTPYPGGGPFEHRWLKFWFDEIPDTKDPLTYWWVNRGGGWTKQESCMESAYRDGQGHMNVGFRCAKLVQSKK